jgi:streptogramin lyase
MGLCLSAAWVGSAAALPLRPDTIFVVDQDGPVNAVDPVTGDITPIPVTTGNVLHDLAFSSDKNLLIAAQGEILEVDGATGNVAVVSGVDFGLNSRGITVDRDGEIFLSEDASDSVFRFHPDDGTVTRVARNLLTADATWIAADLNGDVFVSTLRGITSLDPDTGLARLVAEISAGGMTVLPNGHLVVALPLENRVIVLDPDTGSSTTLTSGGLLARPIDVVLGPFAKTIFVSDNLAQRIVEVALATGEQRLVAGGATLGLVRGIEYLGATAPAVPEPTAAALFLIGVILVVGRRHGRG